MKIPYAPENLREAGHVARSVLAQRLHNYTGQAPSEAELVRMRRGAIRLRRWALAHADRP